jgi:NADPH-dependent 2,4-dienoyl-CoA reductase/sulfur reductase-like enzyme/rhodanese-related sulfurtransferase
MNELLIIGGVAAGATAAARARRLDGDVSITLLEAGSDVSFANCGLPYYIGGDIEYRSSLILSSPQTFHDQYRVDVHTNTEAVRIDREKKVVHAKDTGTGESREFPYDTLILAQGGKPVAPPVPGADREHVFQLWTLDDMDRIHAYITDHSPRNAVVVGGGFIGLEMVEALAKRGLAVSLVEMQKQVMPNLEGEFAGFLTKELQDFGVSLQLGKSLTSIDDGEVSLSDGSVVPADFVLLSVGVRPTLALAKEAGLAIGEAGGLAVDAGLRTSDPAIFAAGDMVEIEHTVGGRKVRMPLAGPANRQGRIAAENALGASRTYRGAMGTSVVKLFSAVAGSTGLSLTAARGAGIDAEAVVVHKTSHTAYYPGAEKVSLMVVFDRGSGKLLGAQAAGRVGVDKRLDVMATAIAGGLTVADLSELDLAYAPPFNSPNGPVNMAAFTAENHRTGFSPSVLAADLEQFVMDNEPIVIDLRDPITVRNAALYGSTNLSHNLLRDSIDRIPPEETVLLISDDGQKGHVALRMLNAAGIQKVVNLSGGYISLERHARAVGLENLRVGLLPVERRLVSDLHGTQAAGTQADSGETEGSEDIAAPTAGPLVIDVRTPMEFQMGAYPGAINIDLDELPDRVAELGSKDREILVYCASGARSAYAERILSQMGYSNVKNAGGLHDIMASGV